MTIDFTKERITVKGKYPGGRNNKDLWEKFRNNKHKEFIPKTKLYNLYIDKPLGTWALDSFTEKGEDKVIIYKKVSHHGKPYRVSGE